MRARSGWVLLGALAYLLLASAASAQVPPVVLQGRVEDAVSRNPIVGVRVFTADSSSVVVTDSLGAFALPLEPGAPFTFYARRLGYLPERFDLDDAASTSISVLILEPDPILIAGIEALVLSDAEAVVLIERMEVLEQRIEDRRNAFPESVIAADRIDLERFAVGSVLDFVRTRSPMIAPCRGDPSWLCVPVRFRSFRTASESRILVCVDERGGPDREVCPAQEVPAARTTSCIVLA